VSKSETALVGWVVQGLELGEDVVSYCRHSVVSECFVPWMVSGVGVAQAGCFGSG
jgi:hypothetical protein